MSANVYCDQNCLIDLEQQARPPRELFSPREVRIVMSPWHWVEIARNSDRSRLVALAEFAASLDPLWLPERRTVQRLEVEAALRDFLGFPTSQASMFRSFEWVASDLVGRHLLIGRYSIKDFAVGLYENPDRVYEGHQQNVEARAKNLKDRRKIGIKIEAIFQEIIAGLLPKRLPNGNELDRGTKELFLSQVTREKLPAIAVEFAIFEDELSTGAGLGFSRFSDNTHVIVSLPYTDYFATRDRQLTRKIVRVREKLPFKTAEPITKEHLEGFLSGAQPRCDR